MELKALEERHRKILTTVWPEANRFSSQLFIQKTLENILILRSDQQNYEVLDLGCGHNSPNLEPYKDRIRLTGVDLDAEAISRHGWLHEAHVSPSEQLPFPDKTFDVVFSRYAFEHFNDKDKSISEISRVLRQDGVCILLTVNRHALEFRLAKLFDPKLRGKIKNFLMNYPLEDTYETNYKFNSEAEIVGALESHSLRVQTPIHLVSTTSGFLRKTIPLCYTGALYSRLIHQFNFRHLMSQMTIVAFKK